ncbi:MAG: IS66 family transposase, partial [Clostridia bacterium]|nr:IS66 family transposase [Clostridia bacterium]
MTDLEKEIDRLRRENAELHARLKWREEQFRLNQQRRFGASSERSDDTQLQLFNEAESEAQPLLAEPTIEKITYERRKRVGRREAMLEDLPVETVEYRLPKEEQVCSCCGSPLHEMSTEVRQELKIIPAEAKVVNHVRYVYSCRQCEQNEITTPIVTAPMPAPVLKGSIASPSAMAFIMTQKYLYSLPLYRQEQQLSRMGIELSRQTPANWMIYAADRWLAPLYERMHEQLLEHDILHADETTLQVLNEPGRPAESQSFLWLFRTSRDGPPSVLYDYQPTRSGTVPRQFLQGFKGYLHVDGYSGYHGMPDVALVGCWAHARRGFDEALKALPAYKRSADVAAREGLEFCNRLFAIERGLENASAGERRHARLERSRPVLDAFLAWLNEQSSKALPKSAFGKAVAYCLNQWDRLEAFLQDGRLELSNNRAERSIRPVVIGRRNWLFANTP